MYDIAVIGYGPVGMVTAALLGRAGYRVVVLERYPTLYNLPRAAIFDDETMRTFDRLGIADSMLPGLHVQRNYEWRNGAGELLIEHSFADVGGQGWAEWYMMYQPDLEDALDAVVRSLPNVEVRMNSKVVGYEQSAGGVEVRIEGDESPLSCKYVVACDGGNSFTRHWLGVGQFDYGFSEPWMVCDFRLTAPTDVPKARQVCDPVQPISIISLGPNHHRFSFMIDAEETFAVEAQADRVWARVHRYLQPDEAELIRVATYTFRSLVADRWRNDRILLAGDAAHQMPPFLGQGMCSGIRDAQNLAMKFDAISGGADESILDSFQSEREPHVRTVIEKGIELGRVQTMRDPVAAAARDALLIAQRKASQRPEKMRFPGLGAGMHDGSAAAGELMPQGRVADDTGSQDLFDRVAGYGFVLLIDDRGNRSVLPPAVEVPDGLRVGVRWLVSLPAQPGELADVDGVYGSWFDETGCAAVLWRPDFYIFGTARTTGEINALLVELAGVLEPATIPASV